MRSARRTEKELVTKYKLEPNLLDVYVEGGSDRNFLNWYFGKMGHKSVKVYTCDDFSLDGVKVSGGKRGKLFHFSHQLSASASNCKAFTVVDRDLDMFLSLEDWSKFSEKTRFTSLPIYFLESDAIVDMYSAYFGKNLIDKQKSSIIYCAKYLFAIRVFLRIEYPRWPNISYRQLRSFLSVEKGIISLDSESAVDFIFSNNGKPEEKSRALEKLNDILISFPSDPRYSIRFGDLVFFDIIPCSWNGSSQYSGYRRCGKKSAFSIVATY